MNARIFTKLNMYATMNFIAGNAMGWFLVVESSGSSEI